jgi:uncharacterized membrane protein
MLQGTGIAVLYLTVFAAMRLHPLLDPSAALGLLVAVTVFSAILAITQDALGLAAAAALGGFAAPILTSTGAGNHVALFSYFALLNAGILAIAWFKAWRLLNLIGFVGTFGIGFAWGLRSYAPELLWSTEPFLILFFLMYLAIGLLFARRKLLEMSDAPEDDSREALLHWSARKGDYVDGTMLFGPPLVGFGLQFALVQHLEFAAAFSALALGMIYMGLARALMGGRLLLAETCLALGVIFASLAIPLGLDARWTSAAWAVEGAGFSGSACVSNGRWPAFALLLQLGSALAFLSELRGRRKQLARRRAAGRVDARCRAAVQFLSIAQSLAGTGFAGNARVCRCWRPGPDLSVFAGAAVLLHPGTAISWALAGLVTCSSACACNRVPSCSPRSPCSCWAVRCSCCACKARARIRRRCSAPVGAVAQRIADRSGVDRRHAAGGTGRDGARRCAAAARVVGGVAGRLVLINLAVLFVLPWQTASAVWAASGLLIIWLSLYLKQRVSFVFGLLLQLIGGAAFLLAGPELLGPLASEGLRRWPMAASGRRWCWAGRAGRCLAFATGQSCLGVRCAELAAFVRSVAGVGRGLVGVGVDQ